MSASDPKRERNTGGNFNWKDYFREKVLIFDTKKLDPEKLNAEPTVKLTADSTHNPFSFPLVEGVRWRVLGSTLFGSFVANVFRGPIGFFSAVSESVGGALIDGGDYMGTVLTKILDIPTSVISILISDTPVSQLGLFAYPATVGFVLFFLYIGIRSARAAVGGA